MKKKIQSHSSIITILKLYGLGLVLFSLFRFVLFFTNLDKIEESNLVTILKSFVMGVRFDLTVLGYILMIPALALFIIDFIKPKNKGIFNNILSFFISVLFALSFFICSADIPFFNEQFERLSVIALTWLDNPSFVISMIVGSPALILYSIPAGVAIYLSFKLINKIIKNHHYSSIKITYKIPLYIVCLGLIFLGIRGRISKKSPIRVGTAYHCSNAFLNKMGLNPVFTLLHSYIETTKSSNKKIHLIDLEFAKNKVKEYYNISNKDAQLSPVLRYIKPDTVATTKHNIVVVMMESMSAGKMQRNGYKHKITPFIDDLATRSLYFENFYSSGIHTFNGVFGTNFSCPSLYRRHTMKQMAKYNGLASNLKMNGYNNIYFTTHDSQFDNIGGFLTNNDFDKIISKKDYPSKEVVNTLGVPDDFMFKFSIPILNKLSKKGPFYANFLTTSNHKPYYVPDYFKPKTTEIKEQIVEYADWSIEQFMTIASKQDWFENTIFVFIADHGAPFEISYDLPVNYYHSPFIIHAPKIIKEPKTYSNLAGQIDVFPTVMGLLKLPYINNSFGIDLFQSKRDYLFVNGDNKIGVFSDSLLLIDKLKMKPMLFRFKNRETENLYDSYKSEAEKMIEYYKTNMQVYQEMLDKKMTYIKPIKN